MKKTKMSGEGFANRSSDESNLDKMSQAVDKVSSHWSEDEVISILEDKTSGNSKNARPDNAFIALPRLPFEETLSKINTSDDAFTFLDDSHMAVKEAIVNPEYDTSKEKDSKIVEGSSNDKLNNIMEKPDQLVENFCTRKPPSKNKKTNQKKIGEGIKRIKLEYKFLCKTHPTRVFSTAKEFKEHEKSNPNCLVKVGCPTCKKLFKAKRICRQHQLTVHISPEKLKAANIQQYKCAVCSKCFLSLGNLKTHESTHTNAKPYKCMECPKVFSGLSNLKSHRLIHSNEKGFQCETCRKGFRQRQSLHKHSRVHLDKDSRKRIELNFKYQCELCPIKFEHPSSLKRHMRRKHT